MTDRSDFLLYAMTHHSTVSATELSIRGYNALHQFYEVKIAVCNGSQSRTFLISRTISSRLWNRYRTVKPQEDVTKYRDNILSDDVRKGNVNKVLLPGQHSDPFRLEIGDALVRKFYSNVINSTWIASPSLYKLWYHSCSVSTELFADCFNESGVLQSYCSADPKDEIFGSVGTWEKNETRIEGGAANPPFEFNLIETLMEKFEEGTKQFKPYCRYAVLPIGKKYDVTNRLSESTTEGTLIISAPPGCFPFQNEAVLLSRDHVKSKPHLYQSIGIVIWCNREYLIKHPPPLDIQEMYQAWVDHYLYNPEKVIIHETGFEKAFPVELRRRESLLVTFVRDLETQQK